jgi:hypothetical protein
MSTSRTSVAALLCAFGLSTGCVHATKTRTEEEKGEKGEKSKQAQNQKDKKRGAQKRSETMETSKTTAAMFKPGGIKKLQAALDEAVRDIDQDSDKDKDKSREKSPPLGALGKRDDDQKKPRNEKEVLAQKDEARKKELTKKIEFVNETGRFDERTQLALLMYQKAEGLPETGLPDYETLRRLGLEPDEILYHEVPAERLGVP